MARIAGINIPQNKLVHIGLTYIYGIGDKFSQQICSSLEIPRAKRVNELTDEEVLKINNNSEINVVYDAVGKDTFEISLKCLNFRGLMVSFGQSSGMINDVNLHSTFNPKSLYFTRPTLMHYIRNSEELAECSNKLFSKIKNKEIKPNIFKKFKLSEASQAHELIQSRRSVGSIILCP